MAPPTILPPSVKIGYTRYRIVEWETRVAIGADRYGECDHTAREIRVALTFGKVKAANTLLHEIMHAIWAIMALSDDDKQERYVNALSNGLSGVWVDNPDVFEWIKAALISEDH